MGCSNSKSIETTNNMSVDVENAMMNQPVSNSTQKQQQKRANNRDSELTTRRDSTALGIPIRIRADSWAVNSPTASSMRLGSSSGSISPPSTPTWNTKSPLLTTAHEPSATTTPDANCHKNLKQSKPSPIESQWKSLWESQSGALMDPADAHVVMDDLMRRHINLLSATEITFIQRRVRSVVGSLPAGSNSKNGSSGGVMGRFSSLGSNLTNNNSQRQQTESEAKDIAWRLHLFSKHVIVNRILRPIMTTATIHTSADAMEETNDNSTEHCFNVMENAYCIMLHLCETLWARVADVAENAAQSAGLEMDVNKRLKKATTSATWKMPKPSIVPDLEAPADLPPGVSLYSLTFVVGLALRGTRQQRLQLLFYLCMRPEDLESFLATHPAGGVPLWLLEVGNSTVISLASLTHYHYYGNAFLPCSGGENGSKTQPERRKGFAVSKSRKPPVVAETTVYQTVSTLLNLDNEYNRPNSHDTTAASEVSPVSNSSSSSPATSRRNSTSQPNLLKRRGSRDKISELFSEKADITAGAATLRTTDLMQQLQDIAEMTNMNRSGDNNGTSRECFRKDYNDPRLPQSEECLMQHLPSPGAPQHWTLSDFALWAEQALDDLCLDAVMFGMFGTGLLPSHVTERQLVVAKWYKWRQTIETTPLWDLMNIGNAAVRISGGPDSEKDNGGDSTIDFLTQSVKALIDSCHNGGVNSPSPSHATTFTHQQQATDSRAVWGGLAGLDGGGGSGYGVLYCIDAAWWKTWTEYTGFEFNGKEGSRRCLKRPGALSTEALLDRGKYDVSASDVSSFPTTTTIPGSLGSYEIMKHGLKRDKHYVLVPPGVWDVLFELYGGGPPIPRMIKPSQSFKERKSSVSPHQSELMHNKKGSNSHRKEGSSTVKSVILAMEKHSSQYANGGSNHTWNGFSDDGSINSRNRQADPLSNAALRIPSVVNVVLHPWTIHVIVCDPKDPIQPYRRGDALSGSPSIRVQCLPDQPIWRLYMEIVCRFNLQAHSSKAFGTNNKGKARLWKRQTENASAIGAKDVACRYGPWNLLCKSRHAILPMLSYVSPVAHTNNSNTTITNMTVLSEQNPTYFAELVENWQHHYSDHSTVQSIGLSDRSFLMLEFAVLNKQKTNFVWPREAAAKAGKVRRLAEEESKFRQTLMGVDDSGHLMLRPPNLVGMQVDAKSSTDGEWYLVTILEVEIVDDETDEDDEDYDDGTGEEKTGTAVKLSSSQYQHQSRSDGMALSHKKIKVDFSNFGGHVEWIDADSNQLAIKGRFTGEAESQSDAASPSSQQSQTAGSNSKGMTGSTSLVTGDSTKPKPTGVVATVKRVSNIENTGNGSVTSSTNENGKLCLWPGFGACGLVNLGNTCYANSAIQCMSYLPLLRSYLLSAQYKAVDDLNRDNPLGTGGKLLEEFAELLRVMWSAKLGEKSPSRFRSQLGKINSQFSGADQQDAQEFLNYMMDVLHEDSNRVRKKPYVEALEDEWVKQNSLPRVGEESWRRFLRRNRSIMADVAMGQVLNTVTCPICTFSSRNFDPFNLLSIPIPTVSDVVFQCTVYRRATPLNCPWVLNKPRKGDYRPARYIRRIDTASRTSSQSEKYVAEQYVISMSRLADSGDLRLQIQNLSGIPAHRLKLCRAESFVINKDAPHNSVVRRQTKVTPLTDREGPCSQLARKQRLSAASNDEADDTTPTRILAFEACLNPRPKPLLERGCEPKDDGLDTADEDEEEEKDYIDNACIHLFSERDRILIDRCLGVYGDEKECRLVDTDPLVLTKAVSRSLWPRNEDELKLGLRVDAKDHRGNWFPGSVVEILDSTSSSQPIGNSKLIGSSPDSGVASEHRQPIYTKRVRVHFDNFSSKWDEMYTIDDFEKGRVQPLYSHAEPRNKPTEFMVYHRHATIGTSKTDDSLNQSSPYYHQMMFGQSFYIQCENEWSNARAGAHILAQACRFLQLHSGFGGPIDIDDPESCDIGGKAQRLYEKTHMTISDLIDKLVDYDREYLRKALAVSEHNHGEEHSQPYRNPTFDGTKHSAALDKTVNSLLLRLPFELRVCTVENTTDQHHKVTNMEEVPFAFSLIRTIGNYMNARHALILQWREPPTDKKSDPPTKYLNAPVMYVEPEIAIDKNSAEILKRSAKQIHENAKKTRPGSAGIDLGVCLGEFCKEQKLNISDNWRCPRCKQQREGRQNMDLWRLPDLLTFHIKRFNMSARWREKITTKVNFPLTGLDMSEWCHQDSPVIQMDSSDSYVYDLIGVVNHHGSMTGGHYIATCRATPCGKDGKEEVAYNFNGAGAATGNTEVISESSETASQLLATYSGTASQGTGSISGDQSGAHHRGDVVKDRSSSWRIGGGRNSKSEVVNQSKLTAAYAAVSASESAEPLWLQFDDDIVEPVPPRYVVTDSAYVLFYRRRRMTPSNIAKYSTLE